MISVVLSSSSLIVSSVPSILLLSLSTVLSYIVFFAVWILVPWFFIAFFF